MSGIPDWFHWLSIISLCVAGLCAVAIAFDEVRRPQHMWMMNLVWPLVAQFWLFRGAYGARVDASMLEFWFAMQIAMMAGFITSYPVNWWLLRAGLKERM